MAAPVGGCGFVPRPSGAKRPAADGSVGRTAGRRCAGGFAVGVRAPQRAAFPSAWVSLPSAGADGRFHAFGGWWARPPRPASAAAPGCCRAAGARSGPLAPTCSVEQSPISEVHPPSPVPAGEAPADAGQGGRATHKGWAWYRPSAPADGDETATVRATGPAPASNPRHEPTRTAPRRARDDGKAAQRRLPRPAPRWSAGRGDPPHREAEVAADAAKAGAHIGPRADPHGRGRVGSVGSGNRTGTSSCRRGGLTSSALQGLRSSP
ncbi:hypothetical protein SAMN05216252_103161 [Actinacidiphila glaucinigra]|uniref:Uncharacterized protein n=1 Tax=Actinacidiphila glaucinigra TaxID=235986 RepID=A0A239BRU4_9ACTN|nr:hypothetical protein SAMN05216252_103161 [Actinacidiphila glaucinigra]